MTKSFPRRSYNHVIIIIILFSVWLTYYSCHAESLEVNKTHLQCVESERDALLHFKQSSSVDHCGLLDAWGHTDDCCQWRGIRCDNQSGHVIGLKLHGSYFEYYGEFIPCFEGKLSVALHNLTYLKYLDLSANNFSGELPKFIGSFVNLENLNLSNAGFWGVIPPQMGNLSKLTSLKLGNMFIQSNIPRRVESLWWLSRMRLLREVDLSGINLNAAKNTWLSVVNNLPVLQELYLDDCGLNLHLPSSLSYINSSTTLAFLGLSRNNLNDTSIFEWLFNLSGLETNLIFLDLNGNEKMFGNNLQKSERVMKNLDKLCSLQTLNLEDTNLNYDFSKIVESFYACPHKSVVFLNLALNKIWGSIPDNIGAFSSLRELDVGYNLLMNDTITQALGKLSMLETLDLSFNSFNGTFTSVHLTNLSQLRSLTLSGNTELEVIVNENWIPPFQLDSLNLGSCKVGPYFPKWILRQKNLHYIDISNCSISDTIPTFFWNSSLMSGNKDLDMSSNMIYGTLLDIPISFQTLHDNIDLSFNYLEGEIPTFLRNNVSQLILSNNNFSKGILAFLCPRTQTSISYLDLSSNFFSEKFPDCWSNFDQLVHLDLGNNNLWGKLPNSIGALHRLLVLHLSNNNLSGELPASLENCKSLIFVDLSYNKLEGHISPSFGQSFHNLFILILQNNRFSGVLPTSFCDISQLVLMDLSSNQISGTIPSCVNKLVSMVNNTDEFFNYTSEFDGIPDASVMWKRSEQTFKDFTTLGLLVGIDLSNNKLQGHIPEGISSLVGLIFLNLSRNNLTGTIMSKIGQLTSLEFLDLSHNHLTGEIPPSLAQVSSLEILDISDNNLTGKIPVSTQLQSFDASSYMGNPGLCGAPLPTCAKNETPDIAPNGHHEPHKVDEFMLGVYISVILGFIVGFWGVCGTLIVKRSWRHAYFRFYEDMRDKVYVIWVVYIARPWRRS